MKVYQVEKRFIPSPGEEMELLILPQLSTSNRHPKHRGYSGFTVAAMSPAVLEDCYAALLYLKNHSEGLKNS